MTTVTNYGRRIADLKALFIDSTLENRHSLSDDLEVGAHLLKLVRSQDRETFQSFVASSHEEFKALPAVSMAIFGLAYFAAPREHVKLRADAVFRALVDKYETEEESYLSKASGDERSPANTLKLWAKPPIFHPTEIYLARTGMSMIKFPMKNPTNEVLLHSLPLASVQQLARFLKAMSLFPSDMYKASEVFPDFLDSLATKSGISASLAFDLIQNLQRIWILYKVREKRKSYDRVLDLISSALESDTQMLMEEKTVVGISEFILSVDHHKREKFTSLIRRLKAACMGCAGKFTSDTLALLGKMVETCGLGDAGFREFLGGFLLDVQSFRSLRGLVHAVEFAQYAKNELVLQPLLKALLKRVKAEGGRINDVQTAISVLECVNFEILDDYVIKDKLIYTVEERKDQLLPRELVNAMEGVSKVKNVRGFLVQAVSALPYLEPRDILRLVKSFITSYDSKEEHLSFFVDCGKALLDSEVYLPERDASLLLDFATLLVPLNLRDRVLSELARTKIAFDLQANYVKASRVVGPLGLPDIHQFLNTFQDASFTEDFANEVIKNGFRTKQFFSTDEILAQLVLLVHKVNFPEFPIKYLRQQVLTRLRHFQIKALVLMLRAIKRSVPDKHVFESTCLRPILLEICERKGKGSDENTDAFEVLLDELEFPEHKIALFAAIRIGALANVASLSV